MICRPKNSSIADFRVVQTNSAHDGAESGK